MYFQYDWLDKYVNSQIIYFSKYFIFRGERPFQLHLK